MDQELLRAGFPGEAADEGTRNIDIIGQLQGCCNGTA
jgi:hypothetical protein